MFAYKIVDKSELKQLAETGTLDRIDEESTLFDTIRNGKTNELSSKLIETIESNLDEDCIVIVQDFDKTSIMKYRKELAHEKDILKRNQDEWIDDFSRVVINTDEENVELAELGMLPSKKKKGIQAVWGLNKKNIKRILTPMEQDIIYSMCNGNEPSVNELHFLVNKVLCDLDMPEFYGIDAFVYDQLYVKGKSFIDLVAYVLKQNGAYEGILTRDYYNHHDVEDYESDYTIYNEKSQVEALDVFNYLCDLKRGIVETIISYNLSKYNMNFPMTVIPEDGRIISRIGVERTMQQNDVYMGSEKVHLIPYTYDEQKTFTRSKRGLVSTHARSNSMNLSK